MLQCTEVSQQDAASGHERPIAASAPRPLFLHKRTFRCAALSDAQGQWQTLECRLFDHLVGMAEQGKWEFNIRDSFRYPG